MSKPETSFRLGVEKYLPPKNVLHYEKMSNPYSGGTADSWYSGDKADLWVEWKFIEVPKREDTMIDLIGGKKSAISHLQQEWLKNNHLFGRNVRVIVGCKEGGVVFEHLGWTIPRSADEFKQHIVSRKELAEFIMKECLREPQRFIHDGTSDVSRVPDRKHNGAAVLHGKTNGATSPRTNARRKTS